MIRSHVEIETLNHRARATLKNWISDVDVALVDFPSHRNAGDSLIYMGQMAHFQALNVRVKYLADSGRYRARDLKRRLPFGPILIQGGGNMGDRWVEMQEFREKVIAENRDRPIIQLPQSLDFSSPAKADQARKVYESHPDLTLLFREDRSLKRARELFPNTQSYFCPDLALGAGPIAETAPPEVDVLFLIRDDSESAGHLIPRVRAGTTSATTDWRLTSASSLSWLAQRAPGIVARRVPSLLDPAYPLLVHNYRRMADINMRNAIRVLSMGRVIVTDRLHATVLAALLGRPVIALDNSTGKVSAVHSNLLKDISNVRIAPSGEAALQLAYEHLR
ncbi:polysaccharide pyruvyl transferase family protein [Salinibacterium sp. ZJ450]|uniref:polysaccharide pyruvyl transferase family protein n=1 Tax=Salinibacterium sp. ZJ450 TaxID=2708338 RepID=UPI001422A479|nr:polysaccharide pyruvyl transferase family protein [Salinibacterium sp. ZJ450]